MTAVLLILAFLLNSAAHLLLKTGANAGLHLQQFSPLSLVRENYITLTGILCFVVSMVCYFMVLRVWPVSVAYPVVVIASFILINIFAYVYLAERVVLPQLFGYAFLLVGIFLIYYFKK